MIQGSTGANVYTDLHALGNLRQEAQVDQAKTIDKVAKQFEAIFLQTMLKGMRDAHAALGKSLFESNDMGTYQEMYDKQLALTLSERGIGFSDMLSNQLSKEAGVSTANKTSADIESINNQIQQSVSMNAFENKNITEFKTKDISLPLPFSQAIEKIKPETISNVTSMATNAFNSKADFVKRLWHEAKPVADKLGLDPKALVAQAALETGWGKKVIKHSEGNSSHNLFGIKAHNSWDKDTVSVKTLEYRDGVANKERADFRSYGSFSESFSDFASFLENNPRYQKALASTHDANQFVRELQKAGYATDPNYANKIISIMNSNAFE